MQSGRGFVINVANRFQTGPVYNWVGRFIIGSWDCILIGQSALLNHGRECGTRDAIPSKHVNKPTKQNETNT